MTRPVMAAIVASWVVYASLSADAFGQWIVVRLGAWAAFSRACGVHENGISGGVRTLASGSEQPWLWYYDPEEGSWHDRNLTPPDVYSGLAYSNGDGEVVGWVGIGQERIAHASVWSGAAHSWVDLNPHGASTSIAFGVGGGVQVGGAIVDSSGYRAGYWAGSAASWVDLSPSFVQWSIACAGNANVQVGYSSQLQGTHHAALWHGTAATFVDLHPSGAFDSYALGASGEEQVGSAKVDSFDRASLWRGTAASWINLHPSMMLDSTAQGAFNGVQVGYATTYAGRRHAALWRGTAASFEDLHTQLGPCFVESAARAVWQDEKYTYVVGYARDSGRPAEEAILWMLPATPFCAADLNRDGFVNGDDFDYFAVYFEAGHVSADFNGDCFVNGNDFDAFAEHFEEGC